MGPLINVTVVSPTATFLEVLARGVQIPGLLGERGVLPNHTAAIFALKPGVITIAGVKEEDSASFFVADGFFHISDNQAMILAKTVEPAQRIDFERASKAEQRAEQRLVAKEASLDIERALASLARARARRALAELTKKK
jgi:F-type H+-transporting ATPase subunit epsilon